MTFLIPMLTAFSSAGAEAPAAVATEAPSVRSPAAELPRRRRSSRLLPFRMGLGVALRPHIQSSFMFSMGTQIRRWERTKLDVTASVSPSTNLWIAGPWRNVVHLDGHVDLLHMASHRLEIGPTVGASLRVFRQTWSDVDTILVPVAGVRASAPLLASRRFSWALDVRGLVDVTPVDLVIESREIRRMSPFQLQVAMRFNFGHGIAPSERAP